MLIVAVDYASKFIICVISIFAQDFSRLAGMLVQNIDQKRLDLNVKLADFIHFIQFHKKHFKENGYFPSNVL